MEQSEQLELFETVHVHIALNCSDCSNCSKCSESQLYPISSLLSQQLILYEADNNLEKNALKNTRKVFQPLCLSCPKLFNLFSPFQPQAYPAREYFHTRAFKFGTAEAIWSLTLLKKWCSSMNSFANIKKPPLFSQTTNPRMTKVVDFQFKIS